MKKPWHWGKDGAGGWVLYDGRMRSRANIWKNTPNRYTWHTWDTDGVGGENAEAVNERNAKDQVIGSMVRQGWAPWIVEAKDMFEKFTERARKVMSLARQESQRLNNEFIGTEHILLGILIEDGGVAVKVLKSFNLKIENIKAEVERLVEHPSTPTKTLGQLPFSPRAKRVIELAGEAASQLGHEVIGTEHLLIAIIKENEGIGAQVLTNLGLKLDAVKDSTLAILNAGKPPVIHPDYQHRVHIMGTIVDRALESFTVLQRDGSKQDVQMKLLQLAPSEFPVGRRIEINISSATTFLD